MAEHAAHRQDEHRVRHDWGRRGARAVAEDADVAVVVDVLSFTTTLSVALDRGTAVLPCRWDDDRAQALGAEYGAVLAVGRRAAGPGRVSLSPATVRAASPAPALLVLPSPNGSSIALELAGAAGAVLGACLRDADAVAGWVDEHHDRARTRLSVVSAGERWPDGSLRPAVEDLWGAGAVLAALSDRGWSGFSPEAVVAREAHRAVAPRLEAELARCAGGRELAASGFSGDVAVAAEVGASASVPLLDGDVFRDAGGVAPPSRGVRGDARERARGTRP